MSKKERVPSHELLSFAERAAYALSSRFDHVAVCGSLRRCAPVAADVDIVVPGDLLPGIRSVYEAMLEAFGGAVPEEGNGPGRPRVAHSVSLGGVTRKVDVWVVPPERLGAGIMHATGSGLFNVVLRRWARRNGMWVDVEGVHRDGRVIASRTEEDCFAALGLPFYRPQDRDPENLGDLLDVLNREAA